MFNDLCTLLLCNKRDELLIEPFLKQYRKVVGTNHLIILGADKDSAPTNNHGLDAISVSWANNKSGKYISEAMFDACLITKKHGCIKMDVDCFVRDMSWIDMRYDYIGHGIKNHPNSPMGLSYYINKLALGYTLTIPCARFQGRVEAQIIYKNLGNIPRDKIIIYSADEVPRKVSNYSWNKDTALIHCGEFKSMENGIEVFDRNRSLEAFQELAMRDLTIS